MNKKEQNSGMGYTEAGYYEEPKINKPKVKLISHFGGDENIANVARVSYAKEASNYTEEQNAKLIKYLIEHKHTSPLRHSTLQFRIKCPIYVERQLF